MNNDKQALLVERINSLTKGLSKRDCKTDADVANTIGHFLLSHMIAARPELMHTLPPEARMIAMIGQLMPEFVNDMATADLRAIAIVLGERCFASGELAQILEGRAATRELTKS